MYFFGYSNEKPHVQYSVADEAGAITHQAAFNLREPIMMHDFAVTQDYAVFLDVPLCYRPQVRVCNFILDCGIGFRAYDPIYLSIYPGPWTLYANVGHVPLHPSETLNPVRKCGVCATPKKHCIGEQTTCAGPRAIFHHAHHCAKLARGAESRGRVCGLCQCSVLPGSHAPFALLTAVSGVVEAPLQGEGWGGPALSAGGSARLQSLVQCDDQSHLGSCQWPTLPTAMQEMITKNLSTALPWHYHPKAGARIGLLPKYAQDASQPRWFDLPGFFAFHTANAWQEGPLVHLFVAAFDQVEPQKWSVLTRWK